MNSPQDALPLVYEKGQAVYFANEDQYRQPKEQFKLVLELVRAEVGDAPISIIDVGCAAGAFLYHAEQHLTLTAAAGTDLDERCLETARKWIPRGTFVRDSLVDPEWRPDRLFDVCTCLGVLSYIDDLEPVLGTLLSYVRPGGRLFILDFVNDDPVDVLMRYRRVEHDSDGPWFGGFNTRSQVTYERLLRRLEPLARIAWTRFEMPFPIPRGPDPMKAWTIATEASPHQGIVGTGTLLFHTVGVVRLPETGDGDQS
jgi:SAM-dependent methyltransferase